MRSDFNFFLCKTVLPVTLKLKGIKVLKISIELFIIIFIDKRSKYIHFNYNLLIISVCTSGIDRGEACKARPLVRESVELYKTG